MAFPLEGIKVLDLSRVVAGPYAGRMLSDMGADVVKMEPPMGDITRVWGDQRHGLSGFYTQQNAGKRNVCVDLKEARGMEVALSLARVVDVVIENFRPGVLERLGLGWDCLSEMNPGLIMLSITGFGQEGPESSRPAYAPVIHAESGIIARQATFDGAPPSDPMLSVADYDAALHGLVSVLAALYMRVRTGQGQHIDMAMLDAMLATDDYAHHILDEFPLKRLGGEVWSAPGGPMLISAGFSHAWATVRAVHGLDDPAGPDTGLEEKIALRRGAFEAWMASFPDRRAAQAALDEAGLAWADVRAEGDAFASSTAQARGMAIEIDDRGGGRRRVVQSPYRFSNAESGLRAPAPFRGEHNGEVLAQWVGMSPGEVEDLERAGVLLAEDRPLA
ncbi:MAG: CaiB/BaiF CoA transferase family protein [Acidimicrobiales bacterium]